jgi:hypothetical protein
MLGEQLPVLSQRLSFSDFDLPQDQKCLRCV